MRAAVQRLANELRLEKLVIADPRLEVMGALSESRLGAGKRVCQPWSGAQSCYCMEDKSPLDIIAEFCMVQDAR